MKKRWVVLSCLLAFCAVTAQVRELETALKDDPDNTEILLRLVRAYHEAGGNGDRAAVKKAESYLERMIELNPENGLVLVYHGSVLTMRARDAAEDWDRMEFMQKGLARLDKGVLFEPKNPEVRLIRGINYTNLPEMFGRLSIAIEDFRTIEVLLDSSDIEDPSFLGPYHFYYGLALDRCGDHNAARVQFHAVMELDPDSGYARRVKERLVREEER